MGKLQIDILGASFAVQAKEDDAYLKKLLGYYKEITDSIQKAGNLKNPLQTSILAGITLVDELYKEKTKNASITKELACSNDAEAERLTMDMIEKIDHALETSPEAADIPADGDMVTADDTIPIDDDDEPTKSHDMG